MLNQINLKSIRTLFILLIAGVLLSSCAPCLIEWDQLPEDRHPNWIMFGGNEARTQYSPGDIALPLKPAWEEGIGSAVGKSLIAADGILYFGTKDGRIHSRKITTGEGICNEKMTFASTCCYSQNHLYIARRYGSETLYGLNLREGKYEWEIDAGDIASEPLITSNSIIVAALYNHIDLYTMNSGVKIWTYDTEDQIRSSPARAGNKIIFGCDDSYVYAVSYGSGDLIWKFETGAAVQANPVIDLKNNLVLIGSSDFNFYALDLEDGTLIWKYETSGYILNGAALADEKIVFSSNDKKLHCLNSINGEKIWTTECEAVVGTNPLIAGDYVFWGGLDHRLYAASLATGKIEWEFKTDGRVRTTPIVWGDYLLAASEDDKIYAFIPELKQ
ncbi:PQQ-binding-like beta-propeller repeat protein [candidate division KSB1 bacterium]|nr:PQQ-binding-like beta-propeller repeat protein [candidate division KSB1 bacterium]